MRYVLPEATSYLATSTVVLSLDGVRICRTVPSGIGVLFRVVVSITVIICFVLRSTSCDVYFTLTSADRRRARPRRKAPAPPFPGFPLALGARQPASARRGLLHPRSAYPRHQA